MKNLFVLFFFLNGTLALMAPGTLSQVLFAGAAIACLAGFSLSPKRVD